MVMKLHGGPLSPFVRKVTTCLAEKSLLGSVSLIRSVTAMVTPNEALMAANPLSKIPTLVTEDGVVLFDSDVICEYLDVTYGSPQLIPLQGPSRWWVLTTTALANGVLDALVLLRFERNLPAIQQAQDMITALETKVGAGLDRFELAMTELAGSGFNLAHVTIGCMFGYLDYRFPDLNWRTTRPLSAAWYETFLLRQSAQTTQPYEYKQNARQDPSLQGRLYWE